MGCSAWHIPQCHVPFLTSFPGLDAFASLFSLEEKLYLLPRALFGFPFGFGLLVCEVDAVESLESSTLAFETALRFASFFGSFASRSFSNFIVVAKSGGFAEITTLRNSGSRPLMTRSKRSFHGKGPSLSDR